MLRRLASAYSWSRVRSPLRCVSAHPTLRAKLLDPDRTTIVLGQLERSFPSR
jgi:hypothetical protein